MTIAARLFLGFLLSVLMLVGVGLLSLNLVGRLRDTTQAIAAHDIWAYRVVQRILQSQITLIDARRAAVVEFMMPSPVLPGAPPKGVDPAVTRWRAEADRAAAALADAIAVASGFEQQSITLDVPGRAATWHEVVRLFQQAQLQFTSLRADSETQFDSISTGDTKSVVASEPKLLSENVAFGQTMLQAEDALQTGDKAGQQRVDDLTAQVRMILVTSVVVALLASLLIAWSVRRSIMRSLDAFAGFAEQVGSGDLGGQPLTVGRDELGRLAAALNHMVESLRQIGRKSQEITSTLNASAAQIRASTQQQAASVEEQLAAIQETAATADEITHSGARIASRAQEVIQAAQASVATSANGLRAVAEAARAMDAIRDQGEMVASNIVALSEKTQAIGEIIMTVNDISERSHLLALNAAIEAAAAGESGRSFAVVASELKVLADQAKDATIQVRSILGEIQRGINTSVMLTEEAVKRVAVGRERSDITERAIEEITASVQESVQTFQQIVASTNQQQIGIEQVMGALQSIRQASQQTASGTRELETAAASLSELSGQLLALSDRYRT
ncbi:methyl-accepting chemotaxis protein [Acidisoma cladoniae]|uniref:methyl-accepting chemotaxis protein n=1 Tax=Acidisoma cladoniae TaxID=3040935 RepID=UPI00254A2984|nr:methyl-accepting chemotaxis protein [Acidisoma sp. PAMC 29798]